MKNFYTFIVAILFAFCCLFVSCSNSAGGGGSSSNSSNSENVQEYKTSFVGEHFSGEATADGIKFTINPIDTSKVSGPWSIYIMQVDKSKNWPYLTRANVYNWSDMTKPWTGIYPFVQDGKNYDFEFRLAAGNYGITEKAGIKAIGGLCELEYPDNWSVGLSGSTEKISAKVVGFTLPAEVQEKSSSITTNLCFFAGTGSDLAANTWDGEMIDSITFPLLKQSVDFNSSTTNYAKIKNALTTTHSGKPFFVEYSYNFSLTSFSDFNFQTSTKQSNVVTLAELNYEPTYEIKVVQSQNGTITTNKTVSSLGSEIEIILNPNELCVVENIIIEDLNGNEIQTTINLKQENVYAFTMPNKSVVISAIFKPVPVTADTVVEKIKTLIKNATIVVTGSFNDSPNPDYNTLSRIHEALNQLYKTNSNVKVTLDFSEVSNLTSIGDGIISGDSSFYYIRNLERIILPSSVTKIFDGAFCHCESLSEIVMPGVEAIRYQAFACCYSLTEMIIPNSVKEISEAAFANCTKLSKVIMSDTVKIGPKVFYNCPSIESIELPKNLEKIENGTFWECRGLKSIVIPEHVTSIGSYAFQECSSLANITIPNCVTSIGSYAFQDCKALTKVAFEDISSVWCITISQFDCTNGVEIGTMSATDTEANAKLLTKTYFDKYFYKKAE